MRKRNRPPAFMVGGGSFFVSSIPLRPKFRTILFFMQRELTAKTIRSNS